MKWLLAFVVFKAVLVGTWLLWRERQRRLVRRSRIATLTRRLDGLRLNVRTRGFRTAWEDRERLREKLAALPPREQASTTTPSIDAHCGTCILYVDKYEKIDA